MTQQVWRRLELLLFVVLVLCVSVGVLLRESQPRPGVVALHAGDTLFALSGVLIAGMGGLLLLRPEPGNRERSRVAAIAKAVGIMLYGLALAAIWVATPLIPLSEADTSNLMFGAVAAPGLAWLLGRSVQWAINRRQ